MSINICKEIERLVQYGQKHGMLNPNDVVYARNRILGVLKLDDYAEPEGFEENLENPVPILDNILEWAFDKGLLESDSPVYRELLDTALMDCIMPRPSEVISLFETSYARSPRAATEYYYALSRHSNYIRTESVARNLVWKSLTEYGEIDITINLSKPEKDPRAIAAARNMVSSSYPKCLLCKENEGYSGRLNHPARQNHRVIPIILNNEKWYFQYSPYVYYNEHCIIFKDEHVPMKISGETFKRLLAFVSRFPHYCIGSNADLPIVGGSILSHDHFQGGSYEFAMAKAPMEHCFAVNGFEDIEAGIVRWPMSVIRLRGKDASRMSTLAVYILDRWKAYSDEALGIRACTGDVPHNTITPIARWKDGCFEMDLVLRNNRTDEEHPDGIFHPHQELHHIKKENIGLIEVMGLAVLPARLKDEMEKLAGHLSMKTNAAVLAHDNDLAKHMDWYEELMGKYSIGSTQEAMLIVKEEIGLKFAEVLKHAGVFKRNPEGMQGFGRFAGSL